MMKTYSYRIIAISENTSLATHKNAELENIDTRIKHYVLFREHNTNSNQLIAMFTDESYSKVIINAVLQVNNNHSFDNLQVGDILNVIL